MIKWYIDGWGGGGGYVFNDGKCWGRKLRSGFMKLIMYINKYVLYNL